MKPYQIYCISAGRDGHLPFTDEELEHIHFITDQPYNVPHNTVGGGLIDSRNLALKMAFDQGLNCVQISDDLVSIRTVENGKAARPVSLLNAVGHLQKAAEKTTANLIGVPPTGNAFYAQKPYVANGFIIGDAFLAKPSKPQFDKKLRLKEDYDFTAQHIADRGTLRVQTMVWNFKHYSNAGGAVAYRDVDKERHAVQYLMNKWPNRFRLHPRRKNEIIVK